MTVFFCVCVCVLVCEWLEDVRASSQDRLGRRGMHFGEQSVFGPFRCEVTIMCVNSNIEWHFGRKVPSPEKAGAQNDSVFPTKGMP